MLNSLHEAFRLMARRQRLPHIIQVESEWAPGQLAKQEMILDDVSGISFSWVYDGSVVINKRRDSNLVLVLQRKKHVRVPKIFYSLQKLKLLLFVQSMHIFISNMESPKLHSHGLGS